MIQLLSHAVLRKHHKNSFLADIRKNTCWGQWLFYNIKAIKIFLKYLPKLEAYIVFIYNIIIKQVENFQKQRLLWKPNLCTAN